MAHSKKNVSAADTASATAAYRPQAGFRETVESIVVAIILALLFRAFVAEAFVIPTGSMAPTLMGAHKDLECSQCGIDFRVGASVESRDHVAVVASICPNCRYIHPLDLKGDDNAATFSGDRILVSKFAYAVKEPERWDVIVFKFPGNPKQNYIKRLVGLPNETLRIRHGDVYARPAGNEQFQIVRKPIDKLLAMSHSVHDSSYQSAALIKAGYPARWQPWRPGATTPPTDSWQVQRSDTGLIATVSADAAEPKWLRYYHHWADPDQWEQAIAGRPLTAVDPYSSRAITDFYAYNGYIMVDARQVYQSSPAGVLGSSDFHQGYRSGGGLDQYRGEVRFGAGGLAADGLHWVGDLIFEADLETSGDARQLLIELVEAGVQYQCRIDLTDGTARLEIEDVEPRVFDAAPGGQQNAQPTAATEVLAGGRHRIRFSNVDDQLLLWVDGDLVEFDAPTTFDASQFRTRLQNHPQYTTGHPLDAAPVGLAVQGGEATVRHLRLDRDKYYIATQRSTNDGLVDYQVAQLGEIDGQRITIPVIQQLMGEPEIWADLTIWDARRTVEFELEADQFFPMGDNSPESQDARCWALPGGHHHRFGPDDAAYRWADASYVPRDLLVGKALVIFWPHTWNEPVPFTPNIRRMGLIR